MKSTKGVVGGVAFVCRCRLVDGVGNVRDDIIGRQQEGVYSASRGRWAFWRRTQGRVTRDGGGMREICKAKTNECSNDKTSMRGR